MNASDEGMELKERLVLIETMMAEGRRTTESFSWVFVLWGLAYYVAIAWSTGGFTGAIWGSRYLAWPVTMTAGCVLTLILGMRKRSTQALTTHARAIVAIWISMGISMFILLLCMGLSGRLDEHVFIAVISTMLGTTNAACGLLLRWKQQFACAIVWWLAAVAALFGSLTQSTIAFLVAIFLCQIVFGIYGMFAEARMRKQREASHA
jgi:hypothetical protein